MNTFNVPPVITLLRERLAAAGFEIEQTCAPERFGNQLITFTSGDLAVRAVNDRGDWSVELSAGGDTGWFLAELWRACVDGIHVEPHSESLSDAVGFVTSRLQQLQQLVADAATRRRLIECLIDARALRGTAIRKGIFGDPGG